jgi:hypothetical protein
MSENFALQIRAHLNEMAEPLIIDLTQVDAVITKHETDLAELRKTRKQIVEVLAKVMPDEYGPKPKVYPKGSKSLVPVSEEMVTKVFDWLQSLNGDEFHASGLMARDDFNVTSASQLSKALNVLHDRSQITLVRMGKGGSKFYRVVA